MQQSRRGGPRSLLRENRPAGKTRFRAHPLTPPPAALPAKEAPEAEQQQEVEEGREHTPLGMEREDTWC